MATDKTEAAKRNPAPAARPQQAQAAPQQKGPATQIACSRGLSEWMAQQNLSFGFTSYQSGRLYLIGRLPQGKVSFHERQFMRAMGVAATPQRFYLATHYQWTARIEWSTYIVSLKRQLTPVWA